MDASIQLQVKSLPKKTGCYIFKGGESAQRVLYVGKAKSLRDRVRQYFTKEALDRRPFVQFIREKTTKIDFLVATSENDALFIENELIKKYRPPYNIRLRDDKRYLSLRLDLKHEWPTIEVTRRIKRDGAVYFGPFLSGLRLKETLKVLQKAFPLRTCSDAKLYNRSRPCLEYEIKRCVAPCVGLISSSDYRKLVESVKLFFRGDTDQLVGSLKQRMEAAVEEEDYEAAAIFRDQIQAIEASLKEQSIYAHEQGRMGVDFDVLGLARDEFGVVISLLFVRSGKLWDFRNFEFDQVELDSDQLVSQFLSQYYQQEVFQPKQVIVREASDIEMFRERFQVIKPRSSEKKKLLEMAEANAVSFLENRRVSEEKHKDSIQELQRELHLKKLPTIIDCVDISHHQGDEIVGSVVRFERGQPNKGFYRKFILETDRIDDFASMKEVLSRRYRTQEELPDLLVVDGGKGQLAVGLAVLSELEISDQVEVVSLAKAREGSESLNPLNPKNRERVFLSHRKNPVLLKPDSAPERLLVQLRDEAHRFAIEFHRQRRLKSFSRSELDAVPGMKKSDRMKLLREFGSIDKILEAEDFDLMKVISPRLLSAVRTHFSQDE
ncbi:MAG: excinuclease ABC subunit UvrC [Bradymonadales bacterium]|nr:MAG: excinuclease ABC subunit UvrC [Bradymonadales bacterium]